MESRPVTVELMAVEERSTDLRGNVNTKPRCAKLLKSHTLAPIYLRDRWLSGE